MQVTLIVWGWAFAQFPYLVPPEMTFFNAAAPSQALKLLLGALLAGMIVLIPSMWYLYRVFKSGPGRQVSK